jgi:hypothetical protein
MRKQLIRFLGNKLIVRSIQWKVLGIILGAALAAPCQTIETAQQAAAVTSLRYHYITREQRLKWLEESTIGPETLTVGLFSAGIGTARDSPPEYGPHWDGFAKRYGIRLTGVATANVMEATLGDLWGEDPRYFRAARQPFGDRVKNVMLMTVASHRRDGSIGPAYARYLAMPGSNFLSNSWRADSEANSHDAVLRTVLGFVGLMSKNAFIEFWPDVREHTIARRH